MPDVKHGENVLSSAFGALFCLMVTVSFADDKKDHRLLYFLSMTVVRISSYNAKTAGVSISKLS